MITQIIQQGIFNYLTDKHRPNGLISSY